MGDNGQNILNAETLNEAELDLDIRELREGRGSNVGVSWVLLRLDHLGTVHHDLQQFAIPN